MTEETIVRENLMNKQWYTPYCENPKPRNYPTGCSNPRTRFDFEKKQFICPACGWQSDFPGDFIQRYITKWNING